MSIMHCLIATILVILLVSGSSGCKEQQSAPHAVRPVVLVTLFPVYDFTRTIAAGRSDVQLLLPPGVEPHHFEPRPEDIVRLQRASMLIYTSDAMEPWVARLLANPDLKHLKVIQAAGSVRMMAIEDHDHSGHDHGKNGSQQNLDPHVWLDFSNAAVMVDAIAAGLAESDTANAAHYRGDALLLKEQLARLDESFKKGLASCRSRILLHGGHYAFGYLAKRYELTYRAAVGVNADAEPSPRQMARLVRQIRDSRVEAVYTEELLSPRLAQTLAAETGARVLPLNGGHNLTRKQLESGSTFFSLMDENLKSLQKGLGCTN